MTVDARDVALLLVTWLLHSSAIGVGALLLLRCFGSPATRAALARFALVAPFVTAAVVQVAPLSSWRIDWPEPTRVISIPSLPMAPRSGDRLTVSRYGDGLQMTVLNKDGAVVRSPEAVTPPQDWRALATVGLWLTGCVLMGIRLTMAVLRHRRLLNGRALSTRTTTAVALQELIVAVREAKPIRLTTLPKLPGPIALARREICVPPGLHDVDPETVRAILAHELAHVQRRDPEWSIATAIITVAAWCQPIVWMLSRAAGRNAELACDEFAAQHAGGPVVVAATLAQVAEWSIPPPLAAGIRGSGRLLVHRVERLLCGRPQAPARRLLACAAAVIMVVVTLFGLPVLSAPASARVALTTASGPVIEIRVPR
jgi:beta-lactamase regulating signal transducer with metallopeptidase domain